MACTTKLVRCLVLAVLGALLKVDAISTSDIGDKPGTCPQATFVISSSIIGGGLGKRSVSADPCEHLCLNDFDCQGVKKCCSGSCGKVCLTPEVDKPGTCPLPTLLPPSIDVSGERSRPYNFVDKAGSPPLMLLPNDFVGSGKSRHYNTIVGGGHSGPSSVGGGLPGMSSSSFGDGRPRPSSSREHDGQHPPAGVSIIGGGLGRRSRSAGDCQDQCLNDFDCDEHKKCCRGSCGRICLGPLAEKHGTCPLVVTGARGSIVGGGLGKRSVSTDPCQDLCRNDYDCQGVKKCCTGSCGRECMSPEGEKPGTCPKSPPRAFSSIVGGGLGKRSSPGWGCQDACLHDFDCDSERKCCDGDCGKICLDPLELTT